MACYYQGKTGHPSGREILGRGVGYLVKLGCLRVAEYEFPPGLASRESRLMVMNYAEDGDWNS